MFNVFNTVYSKYSRSVLEVGLKLHRILRDGPGLIDGLFYGRFLYAVLVGQLVLRGYLVATTSTCRFHFGKKLPRTGQLRPQPTSITFLSRVPSGQLRFHCVVSVCHHLGNVLTSTCTFFIRFNVREFQQTDMSTGWSRGISEVATD